MTDDEVTEVLRLHKLWRDGDPAGKRADLRGADLGRAKGILRIGPSRDGYEFFAVRREGTVWIKAGCRWFTAAGARAHWSKPRDDEAPQAERLRFLDFLEANCPE